MTMVYHLADFYHWSNESIMELPCHLARDYFKNSMELQKERNKAYGQMASLFK